MIKGELKNAVACERSGQGILSEASFSSIVVSAHPFEDQVILKQLSYMSFSQQV